MKVQRKHHPILFQSDMIKAIQENRKTQTRRKLKSKVKYKKGDILFVRESFMAQSGDNHPSFYLSDLTDDQILQMQKAGFKKKPSIHLPKTYSRIWLQVTAVRTEPLQLITRNDAIREGIEKNGTMKMENMNVVCWKNYLFPRDPLKQIVNPINSFKTLWQSINGVENWHDNPTVIVITFRRLNDSEIFEICG
jgi:hypothetical protein